MPHRLRQSEDVAAECQVKGCAVRFSHGVRTAHSRDAGGDKRLVQNQPTGVTIQRHVWVPLAREERVFRLGRPEGRSDPFGKGDGGPGMDDDGAAGPLALAILAAKVQPRQHLAALVDLAQLQAQQFADPQAGADTEDEERAVAPAPTPAQIPEGEVDLGFGEGRTSFHGAKDRNARSDTSENYLAHVLSISP